MILKLPKAFEPYRDSLFVWTLAAMMALATTRFMRVESAVERLSALIHSDHTDITVLREQLNELKRQLMNQKLIGNRQ